MDTTAKLAQAIHADVLKVCQGIRNENMRKSPEGNTAVQYAFFYGTLSAAIDLNYDCFDTEEYDEGNFKRDVMLKICGVLRNAHQTQYDEQRGKP